MTRIDEIRERAESAELPYHIGHINEANSSRMDVVSERGLIVADDTLSEYANFICHASKDIPYLLRRTERLEKTLKEILELIERGIIVRNIDDDGSAEWARQACKVAFAVVGAHSALRKDEE